MPVSVRTTVAATLLALAGVLAAWLLVRHEDSLATVRTQLTSTPTSRQAPPDRRPRVRATEAVDEDDVVIPGARADEGQAAPRPVESQVVSGLRWLASHQDADGGWHDPATTGMVLLAFNGAGETHQSGSKREIVKKALTGLIAGQDSDGCLVARTRGLRDHAIAGLALTEAYGMTGSRSLRGPAQKAVAFALKSRRPSGAWNSAAPDDPGFDVETTDTEYEFDIETTAWMALLLKSADMSELDVDRSAFPKILATLDGATNRLTGCVRPSWYAPVPVTEAAAAAMGFTMRVFLDSKPEERRNATAADWLAARPFAAKDADWLVAHLPAPDTDDLRFVYFGSVGMINVGGEPFRAWLPALNAVVARPSVADGPDKGSWDPAGGGSEVERIWATAYHLRLCEFYYGPVGHASMRK